MVLKQVMDRKRELNFAVADLLGQVNLAEKDIKRLKLLIRGALRHFSTLSFAAMSRLPSYEKDDDEIYLAILALYELRYSVRTLKKEEVREQTEEAVRILHLRLSEKEIDSFLSSPDFRTDLPVEAVEDPWLFCSLNESVPYFLLEKGKEQYGEKELASLIRTLNQKRPAYVMLNPMKGNREELLSSREFVPSPFSKDVYTYIGRTSLISNRFSKEGKAFGTDLSYALFYQDLDLSGVQDLLCVYGTDSDWTMSALAYFRNLKKADVFYANEMDYRRAKYRAKRLSYSFFRAGLFSLKAEDGMKKGRYDFVIASPDSSSLGSLSDDPTPLARLKESDFVPLEEEEGKLLSSLSLAVKDGGYLLYQVKTVNKEEGHGIAEKFLSAHPEFEMKKETGILPDEYGSFGVYYALFRKK